MNGLEVYKNCGSVFHSISCSYNRLCLAIDRKYDQTDYVNQLLASFVVMLRHISNSWKLTIELTHLRYGKMYLDNRYTRLVLIYVLWMLAHYAAAHLYTQFCVPVTLVGFLMSPFIIATPHCQALRWTVYNGGLTIANMWLLLGVWLCSNIKMISGL